MSGCGYPETSTSDGGKSGIAEGQKTKIKPRRKPKVEQSALPNGWVIGPPANLGRPVNSDVADAEPCLSADGRTLIFSSARLGGTGSLWMSTRGEVSKPFGEPVNLGKLGSNAGAPCLSADGLTLVFQSDRPGGQGGRDLWMSKRDDVRQPFAPPVNLGPSINTKSEEDGPCLSADGLTLLFNSGRPGGQGGDDLWMSKREAVGKPFGEPVNLGLAVNSNANDRCPTLSVDRLTLLFQSARPVGPGKADLWMCMRANTDEPFGEPVNLGPPINSHAHDGTPFLSADGRTLLFESDRPGGQGGIDLYQASISIPPPFKVGSKVGEQWDGNALRMTFCWCPAGKFTMGSPANEPGRIENSESQVEVTLTRGFWLGQTEVTQGQWTAVVVRGSTDLGTQPDTKVSDAFPATNVTWNDAAKFCEELTEQERTAGRLPPGWKYRLPTEAQWEYACRAGTLTAYSFGDDSQRLGDYAWFDANTRKAGQGYAHQVALKKPNPWGLYDMHGNVFEMCRDCHEFKLPGGIDPVVTKKSGSHATRGGCWNYGWGVCRSSSRPKFVPRRYRGFRVAVVQSGE